MNFESQSTWKYFFSFSFVLNLSMIALYFDCILDLVKNILGYNLTLNFDALRKWKKSTF